MIVKTTKKGLLDTLESERSSYSQLGLVPTMGALHRGHFSLIERALQDCDRVIVSIFINPTQFNSSSDLAQYPNNLNGDIEKLRDRFDNLVIFAPATEEIYDELKTQHFDFGGLDQKMEGAFREGHFDGVGTIVSKLLTLIRPDKAYFGEKDYQQLLIVRKLVELLNLPVQIVGCPIDREANGLARSSRNERLSPPERQKAVLLYRSLRQAKNEFGTKNVEDIIKEIEMKFQNDSDFKLDYFVVAEAETLESAVNIEKDIKYRAFIAAFLGEVRLIDNMALN